MSMFGVRTRRCLLSPWDHSWPSRDPTDGQASCLDAQRYSGSPQPTLGHHEGQAKHLSGRP